MNPSSENLYAPAPQNPWKGLGCLEDPFRVRFDARFVYLGDDQKRGLERLVQSVRAGDGLSLISGAAGSGKTTLLSRLAADLATSTQLILFFATPPQTLAALVQECRHQKGDAFDSLSASSNPAGELRTILSGFDPQALPLLLIDEAQSLADGVLGDLLRLAAPDNGTTSGGRRLLQMVLAGDPSLVRRLQTEPVRNLSVSVGCHYPVPALPKPQVSALIRHRLRAAGCENCEPFADDAVARIADYGDGVVGTVNNLCRLALFFSAKAGEAQVSVNSVDRGASALLLTQPRTDFSAPQMLKPFEPTASRDMADGSGFGIADAQAGPLPGGTAARSADRTNSEQTSDRHPQGAEAATAERDRDSSSRGIHPSDGPSRGPLWVRLVAALSVLAATGTLLAFHVSSLKHRQSGPGVDRVATPLPSDTVPMVPVTAEPVNTVDSEPAGLDKSQGERPEQVSPAKVSVSPSAGEGSANDARDRELPPPVTNALSVNKVTVGDAEIDSLLAQAKAHFDADRLVAPRFDNALAVYRQILRVSPGNPSALNGVAAVRARLFAYAQAEFERGDAASTRSVVEKIQSIDAELGQLGEDVSELAEGSLDSKPPLSSPGNLRLRVDTGTSRSSP